MDVAESIAILIFLIAVNGFFAAAEIALVTARQPQLRQQAERGSRSARRALALSEAPARVLSTVQIGITLVGIVAGAFGGATLAEDLAARLDASGVVGDAGRVLAYAAVTAAITLATMVFGELVPKQLGLRAPERLSAVVALPVGMLQRLLAPAVWLTTTMTRATLRLMGSGMAERHATTEEEIRLLLHESTHAGEVDVEQQQFIENVFALDDRPVHTIMTPRSDICWLDADAGEESWRREMEASYHTRFPVAAGSLDKPLGIVYVKDLIDVVLRSGSLANLPEVTRQALVVPEEITALQLLTLMRAARRQIAIVTDEFGSLSGLVTLNDVIDEIVGAVPSAVDPEHRYVRPAEDGSWLVEGMAPWEVLLEAFPELDAATADDAGSYQTVSGFVTVQMARLPRQGDCFSRAGLRFRVEQMDGYRVATVRIRPAEG